MTLEDELLRREPGPGTRLLYGIVTDDSPLTVKVGASTVGQRATALGSYNPAVGDYVAVLVQGGDRLVLGVAGAFGRYAYQLRRTATQSVNATSSAVVSWDTTVTNTGGFSAPSAVITVPVAGVYSVASRIQASTGHDDHLTQISIGGQTHNIRGSGGTLVCASIAGYPLAASGTITISFANGSGSSVTITADVWVTRIAG